MPRKTFKADITDELQRLVLSSMAWYDTQEARELQRIWTEVNKLGLTCSSEFAFFIEKGFQYLSNQSGEIKDKPAAYHAFLMSACETEVNSQKRERLKQYLATLNYDGVFALASDVKKRFEWEATKSYLMYLESTNADLETLFATRPIILGNVNNEDIGPRKLNQIEDEEDDDNYFQLGINLDARPVIGNFLVFASRPGVGKSLAMLNMAYENALAGEKILFISLEMTDKQLKTRLTKHVASVEKCPSTSRAVSKTDTWKTLDKNLLIWVPETHSAEIVLAQAAEISKREQVKIIFIDYLQLLKYSTKDEWASIRQLTFELKQFALRESVLMCSASQVSRSSTETTLDLTSMFGSSSIESDTDIVIGLECNTRKRFKSSITPVNIKILKNRQGALDETTVMIDYSTGIIGKSAEELFEEKNEAVSEWESATARF